MESTVGKALSDFEAALVSFEDAARSVDHIYSLVFEGTDDWRALLSYKLVPHLSGGGCLVVAVAGGTNTGKSTVFNLLVHDSVSPMVNTAAATCHPVLVGNERRVAECLDSKLVPEFHSVALTNNDDATNNEIAFDTLFVCTVPSLPDRMVIMDTPDVDSIDQRNWTVADHIRAAGDVLIAVVTGEKYRDDRVVQFFKEARRSGRVVVPLMNKANPADDFAVARQQISDFQNDVGTESPAFVIGHDFEIGNDLGRSIQSLHGGTDLHEYLSNLDVPAIKERVFLDTVAHFTQGTETFLERTRSTHKELRELVDIFEGRAHHLSEQFEPAPGKEVGGLFHEYVQARRGPVRRTIGKTSAAVARGAASVGRRVTRGIRRRLTLDVVEETARAEDALYQFHRQSIERLAQEMIAGLTDQVRGLAEPYRELVSETTTGLNAEEAVEAVVQDTLKSENISEEFREHAKTMLDTWWQDHTGKRRALEALDATLAVMPAAIAAPLALYAGGVGVAEAMVVAGPLTAQFLTRVMEFQFGDAMFDFLSPWREEQQAVFDAALKTHVLRPALEGLYAGLEPFEGPAMEELRRCHEALR